MRRTRGQAIVLFALMLPLILLALGLVVDGGMAFYKSRDIQNAADSAAFTAVYAICYQRGLEAEVLESARSNGFDDTELTVDVWTMHPPADIPDPHFVEVGITVTLETNFLRLLGLTEYELTRSTTAFCDGETMYLVR